MLHSVLSASAGIGVETKKNLRIKILKDQQILKDQYKNIIFLARKEPEGRKEGRKEGAGRSQKEPKGRKEGRKEGSSKTL